MKPLWAISRIIKTSVAASLVVIVLRTGRGTEGLYSLLGWDQVTHSELNMMKQFSEDLQVSLWIDVPNAFPWRECLHIWDNHLITVGCSLEELDRQTFMIKPIEDSPHKFRLYSKFEDQCVEPQDNLVQVGPCIQTNNSLTSNSWSWNLNSGQLYWGGQCLSSVGSRERVRMVPCDDSNDAQIVEVGQWTEKEPILLSPINLEAWTKRVNRNRDRELYLAGVEVDTVLGDIKKQEISGELYKQSGSRRAVIFYLDSGSGFLTYLTWWIHAWRQIGLDSQQEEFDILLMTHPTSVSHLPAECSLIPNDFDPRAPGPGRCLYRELVGIFERDSHYDHYLNSQECLEHLPWLGEYSSILRADMDTFPTPGILGLRPDKVICYRGEDYTHHKPDIETAIVESAQAAGIVHQHWHNTASSWFGPSRRILALARLTTVVSRFLRAHMFGPGTRCRCATCSSLPKDCSWGSGIYAGTLLLYAQEIAMNRLWSQEEYEAGGSPVLDGSTTDGEVDVCDRALLHCRHNEEPFSKFAFILGKYNDWDMGQLDITRLRDYTMFMALSSAGQGFNREKALEKFKMKTGHDNLKNYCAHKEENVEEKDGV